MSTPKAILFIGLLAVSRAVSSVGPVAPVLPEIHCATVEGSPSEGVSGALSEAKCPDGYLMTSCGSRQSWLSNEGSFIENNICYARNGGNPVGDVHGIIAIARCCSLLNKYIECSDVKSIASEIGENKFITATCGSNKMALGCSVQAFSNELDGACPGNEICSNRPGITNPGTSYPVTNQCTAVNGGSSGAVYAGARCCGVKGEYTMNCIEIWGEKSATSDDAKSTVSCPSGYFLSGCSGYTENKKMDGFYIKNEECVAQNGGHGTGAYAIATCCSIKIPPFPVTIECTTVYGEWSSGADDAISQVSCPISSQMTSCGGRQNVARLDGTFIRDNVCYARNGGGSNNGAQAIARCCSLGPLDVLRDVVSPESEVGDDKWITARCNDNEVLIGCTVSSMWSQLDGACPGDEYCYNRPGLENPGEIYPLQNQCTAVNGGWEYDGTVNAEARCLTPMPGTAYDCIEKWGPMSEAKDDATSTVKCPEGYFLSGCSGYTAWAKMDGFYTENDECVAQNGHEGKGIWAIAICCRASFLEISLTAHKSSQLNTELKHSQLDEEQDIIDKLKHDAYVTSLLGNNILSINVFIALSVSIGLFIFGVIVGRLFSLCDCNKAKKDSYTPIDRSATTDHV